MFANYFASYMAVSFDLESDPGLQLVSDHGCWCDLCTRLARAPALTAKRVGARDKQQADHLIEAHIADLAKQLQVALTPAQTQELRSTANLRRSAALATYGAELVRRCQGAPSGPEALVLWRRFAWHPSGSPIHGFELCAEEVLQAERELSEAIILSAIS